MNFKIIFIFCIIALSSCVGNEILDKTNTESKSIPDIYITESSNLIANGNGSYHFGSVVIGFSRTVLFTIENKKAGDLLLTGSPAVLLGGTDLTEFSIIQPSSYQITGQGKLTFSITFTPTSAGTKTASITILNNDASKSSYQFSIQGTATTAPRITLKQGTTEIPSLTGSYDFGSSLLNTPKSAVFTIENIGTTDLILDTASPVGLSGTNLDQFTVAIPSLLTIPAGSTAAFTVSFNPTSAGIKTALVTIKNNAVNESSYVFTIKGNGTTLLEPEIDVKILATNISIASGSGNYDFGSVYTNSSSSASFTVENIGTSDLALSGTPLVSISGDDSSQFSVSVQPPLNSISVGSATAFTVLFSPTSAGNKVARITIANNDSDEASYTFTIKGSSTIYQIPVISVKQGSTAVSSGTGTYDFGSVQVNSASAAVAFTIENTGNTNLLLNTTVPISLSGTHTASFTFSQPASTTIAAGSSTTFNLSFSPSSSGLKSALVVIQSNDPSKPVYTFTITGTATVNSEIIMKDPSSNTLNSGSGTYSFGSVQLNTSSTPLTFTIENTGNKTILLNTSAPIALSAGDINAFSFSQPVSNTIAAGGSTTFTLTFSPLSSGSKSAVIAIQSNDPSNPVYTFTVTGTGANQPEINIKDSSGNNLLNSAGTYDFGSVTRLSYTSAVFTIQNTGTDTLSLTGSPAITLSGTNASLFSIASQPISNSVAADGSLTFTIHFYPNASSSDPALKTATVTVANNDSDESSYSFTITGTDSLPANYDWKYDGIWMVGGKKGTAAGATDFISELDVYDPYKDEWHTISDAAGSFTPFRNAAAAAYNNKIYVFGGLNSAGTLIALTQVYDIATNTWSTTTNGTSKHGHNAVAVGGSIYVMGGSTGTGITASATVQRFKTWDNTWQTMAVISYAGVDMAVVNIDDQILYVGGRIASGALTNATNINSYIPLNNVNQGNVSLLQDVGKYGHTAAYYSTSTLKYAFFIGGAVNVDTTQFPTAISTSNKVEVYIPYSENNTRIMFYAPSLQTARAYGDSAVKGDFLFAFGGASSASSVLDSVERTHIITIDSTDAAWEYKTAMPRPRYGFNALKIR